MYTLLLKYDFKYISLQGVHRLFIIFIAMRTMVKRLTDMPKTITVDDFQRFFYKWERHLHRCVAARIKTSLRKKSISLLFRHTT